MPPPRNPERISYKIQVLIHDKLGNEFDALFPPGSDKRVSVSLSRVLRPMIEEKLREMIREEQERARVAGQKQGGRTTTVLPVPRVPGIPEVPRLTARTGK